MAVYLGTLINKHFSTPEKADEKAPETAKTHSAALEVFSRTGKLSQDHFDWSKNLNPSYALFNCQRTCLATARFLETGSAESVTVIPRIVRSVSELTEEIFPEMRANRDFAYFEGTRAQLEDIMQLLGKGTHAIIHGNSSRYTGHLFNYAYYETEQGKCRFDIVDSYGGSYRRMGLEQPDAYFSRYRPTLRCAIFYNDTKINRTKLVLDDDKRIVSYFKPQIELAID